MDISTDQLTAERIAENDATFRAANEQIRDAAEAYDTTSAIPFICECATPECTQIIRLPIDVYEHVRSESTHFLNATDHNRPFAAVTEIVERHDGYDIVKKLGRAGEVAEELDPRSQT